VLLEYKITKYVKFQTLYFSNVFYLYFLILFIDLRSGGRVPMLGICWWSWW